jgi:hypothetical protein
MIFLSHNSEIFLEVARGLQTLKSIFSCIFLVFSIIFLILFSSSEISSETNKKSSFVKVQLLFFEKSLLNTNIIG